MSNLVDLQHIVSANYDSYVVSWSWFSLMLAVENRNDGNHTGLFILFVQGMPTESRPYIVC